MTAARAVTRAARLFAWSGLAGAGAVHAVWATGSPWPARSFENLGEAVVGNSDAMPPAQTCWVVATGAITAGAIVAGGGGEGRVLERVRMLIGVGLLARAAFGGAVALRVLHLRQPGARFVRLDRTVYRPAFALLGIATLVGASHAVRQPVGAADSR